MKNQQRKKYIRDFGVTPLAAALLVAIVAVSISHGSSRHILYGIICSKCKSKKLFANLCRGGKYTKQVYQVETKHVDSNDDSSNYFFVGTVTDRKHSTNIEQKWQAMLIAQGNRTVKTT